MNVLHCEASAGADAEVPRHVGILVGIDGDKLEKFGVSTGYLLQGFGVSLTAFFTVGEVVDQRASRLERC